jgi:putative SOS response-associated peptidase YedK
MCGRYYRKSDKQKIAEAFHVTKVDDFVLPPWDYNVAPTAMQPITHAAHAKPSAPKETPQHRSRANAATPRAASTSLPTKTESMVA